MKAFSCTNLYANESYCVAPVGDSELQQSFEPIQVELTRCSYQ